VPAARWVSEVMAGDLAISLLMAEKFHFLGTNFTNCVSRQMRRYPSIHLRGYIRNRQCSVGENHLVVLSVNVFILNG